MPEETPRPNGCGSCKKNCSVFFTRIVNGETGKVAMCADCPFAKSLLDPAESGLLSQILEIKTPETSVVAKCPVCGFTATDFKKYNRLGCPHCYEYLSGFVNTLLERVQPQKKHHGKEPHHKAGALLRTRLRNARAELDAAVTSENFERAVKLRDEIRGLESDIAAEESAAGNG